MSCYPCEADNHNDCRGPDCSCDHWEHNVVSPEQEEETMSYSTLPHPYEKAQLDRGDLKCCGEVAKMTFKGQGFVLKNLGDYYYVCEACGTVWVGYPLGVV